MNTNVTEEIYKLIKESILDDLVDTINAGYDLTKEQKDLKFLYSISDTALEKYRKDYNEKYKTEEMPAYSN